MQPVHVLSYTESPAVGPETRIIIVSTFVWILFILFHSLKRQLISFRGSSLPEDFCKLYRPNDCKLCPFSDHNRIFLRILVRDVCCTYFHRKIVVVVKPSPSEMSQALSTLTFKRSNVWVSRKWFSYIYFLFIAVSHFVRIHSYQLLFSKGVNRGLNRKVIRYTAYIPLSYDNKAFMSNAYQLWKNIV